MDGSVVFARWRQCAPRPNTCFCGPTRVQIPNGISIGSAFCTAHGRVSLYFIYLFIYFTLCHLSLSLTISPSHGDLNPYLIHGSVGPPESSPQTASRSVHRFCTAHHRVSLCPYILQWAAPSPQNCPFPWGIWIPSNTWFLGPTQVLNANAISIGSAFFAELTSGLKIVIIIIIIISIIILMLILMLTLTLLLLFLLLRLTLILIY